MRTNPDGTVLIWRGIAVMIGAGVVDDRAVGYPDPCAARDAAQFIALLKELRAWSGQVSMRRLRSLGGSATSASGAVVDALPPTTVSDILAGKRLPSLPRRMFVEAFVIACLLAHGYCAEEIEPLLASWVGAWQDLTLRQTMPSVEPEVQSEREPGSESDREREAEPDPAPEREPESAPQPNRAPTERAAVETAGGAASDSEPGGGEAHGDVSGGWWVCRSWCWW
jgi:hypothetical protein